MASSTTTASAAAELRRASVGLYSSTGGASLPAAPSSWWWNPFTLVPSLPPYSGPYAVGTADLEWRDERTTPPAGAASTLLARVFYPSSHNPSSEASDGDSAARRIMRRALWLPHWLYARGYGEFLRLNGTLSALINYPAVGWVRMPALWKAPVAQNGQYPVVIFSHGLGGMRTTYSHVAGDLASYGFVVFALEHRDGSASASSLHNHTEVIKYKRPDPAGDAWTFRHSQLQLRAWEMEGAVAVARQLAAGEAVANIMEGGPEPRFDWRCFKGRLDMGRLVAAGHSFGAATALTALQRPGNPFSMALAMDAWMWPTSRAAPPITAPVLCTNSETFFWRENVEALHALHEAGHDNSLYLTLRGTAHQNHSDLPLLLTRVMRLVRMAGPGDPLRAIELNNWACLAFLKRELSLPSLAVPDLEEFLRKEGEQDEILVGFDGLGLDLGLPKTASGTAEARATAAAE